MLTNFKLDKKQQQDAYNGFERMRTAADPSKAPDARPLDRGKMEQLKKLMREQPMGRKRRA